MDKEPNSEDQARAPERDGAPRDSDAGDPITGFREPLGENAVERLRRYQVMTIPPDARAAFLSAKLPGASPELLYDTLPPKAGVEHPGGAVELPQEEPWFAAEPAEHLGEGTGPIQPEPEEVATSEGPVASARQLRTVAVIGGILFLAAVLLAWIAFTRDREIQRAVGPQVTAPQRNVPVIVMQPQAAPPTTLAAAPETALSAVTPEPPPPPSPVTPAQSQRKPETHTLEAPRGTLPVAASPPPVEPAVVPSVSLPASPPAPSAAASGKKFRLGSR
jgi:hypothetical protein